MSRKPRFVLPGVPQHVIQRGHNREPCFFAEEDYQRYLHDVHEAALRNELQIHAYVLMTNHVHLLVTPKQPFSVMHTMQDLGRKYVRYINHSYKRTGGLWEGRYKASLVDSEAYLLTCMRYIEMNPVRAGMVEHPGEYRWSSYGINGNGKPNGILTRHPLYLSLGQDNAAREQAYRELFRHQLDSSELHSVREALNQELVLGREDFKEKIEIMLQRQVRPGVGRRPRVEEDQASYEWL
jgi:putative transposase